MKSLYLFCFLAAVVLPLNAAEFTEVSFEASDGGTIFANLYGEGEHAVILAHGAVFNKESWHAQALAMRKAGLQALSIDFRGYGKSKAGRKGRNLSLDVLAGISYLKANGAKRVSILGGSMGGGAAGEAASTLESGEIHKLILLAHAPVSSPKKLTGNKLFVVSEGDRIARSVKDQFKRAPEPKRLEILEGDAHAQHIFKTRQAGALMSLILDFLAN